MPETTTIQNVLVTGATGFVGRNIVRELLAKGYTPVCLVRSETKLRRQHLNGPAERIVALPGNLSDRRALAEAAGQCQAVIHLVGIIIERRLKGQTFERIHRKGTQHVVSAAIAAGARRFIHMSALGTRPNAISRYHQTKWAAEEYVRNSGLSWTIFRPSLIHGPEGEFMRLMKRFVAGFVPPVIPYFGTGLAKIQPVHVKDVARCIVDALFRPEAIGQTYELGGPEVFTWRELYEACRRHIPHAKRWKPIVAQPVPAAKAVSTISAPLLAITELAVPSVGLFRFDRGQVQMSQEDSVCDHTVIEKAFGISMRRFEDELAAYADQIR